MLASSKGKAQASIPAHPALHPRTVTVPRGIVEPCRTNPGQEQTWQQGTAPFPSAGPTRVSRMDAPNPHPWAEEQQQRKGISSQPTKLREEGSSSGTGIQRLHYLLPSYYVPSCVLKTVLSLQKLVASGAAKAEAQQAVSSRKLLFIWPP